MQKTNDQIDDEIVIALREVISTFISNITSLKESLPLYGIVGDYITEKFNDELKEFIDKYCTKTDEKENGDNTGFTIEYAHYREFKSKKLDVENIGIANQLLPRNVLVSMISQYDAFVRNLLIIFFTFKPELVNQSDKNFRYSDIAEFVSIDDFKRHVIERLAEACIRESHDEQFKIISKTFSIKLEQDLLSFPKFIEICERRNLFVHCDGSVSRQYLDVCEKYGIRNIEHNVGKKLGCDLKYVANSYNILMEIGIKLSFVLWKKIFHQTNKKADSFFSEITFDLILGEQYELVEELLFSALKMWDKKFSSDEYKLITEINLAQTYKWQNKKSDCINLLMKRDWSTLNAKYRLAKAVLFEEWEDAYILMEKVSAINDLNDVDYRDWPLFKEFIEQQEFREKFKEIYKKDFELMFYDVDDTTDIPKKTFSIALEKKRRGANSKEHLSDK